MSACASCEKTISFGSYCIICLSEREAERRFKEPKRKLRTRLRRVHEHIAYNQGSTT